MTVQLLQGNCLDTLKTLEPNSVQCVVTSPPYYGLRDYGTAEWEGGNPECDHKAPPAGGTGAASSLQLEQKRKDFASGIYKSICGKCGAVRVDSQIGLEETPEAYVEKLVAVFRECWRVLKNDGTLWLNLGDSYAGSGGAGGDYNKGGLREGQPRYQGTGGQMKQYRVGGKEQASSRMKFDNLKPKDLIGIPWAVATALRDPYYTGNIKHERDRIWLAATLESEGTICGFRHDRSDGTGIRTGVNITITNTSDLLLNECHRIWPASRAEHENHGEGHRGGKPSWRWVCNEMENRIMLLRELYPYMVSKRTQAILTYNLLLFMVDAKRLGKTAEIKSVHEKRDLLVSLLSDANHNWAEIPNWCIEPPSVLEPGWYLRQDIIWAKPNPMPESVTDRCTKSHEYIFLLSKSPQYFYDADAVREPLAESTVSDKRNGTGRHTQGKNGSKYFEEKSPDKTSPDLPSWYRAKTFVNPEAGRNRRDVWTVTTKPYKGAHFATFPPDLIEPCILAGSREGDVVLDPFNGSGTTGAVSVKHRRNYIGCELNPEYIELTKKRLAKVQIEAPL